MSDVDGMIPVAKCFGYYFFKISPEKPVFITTAKITNVRSIREVDWTVPTIKAAGWHVIIGDNGAGKSTFLRAIALSLIGFSDAMALRQDWNDWVRKGGSPGSVQTSMIRDREFDPHQKPNSGRPRANYTARIQFEGILTRFESPPTVWNSPTGWFSASFGPFRRFTGGDQELGRLYFTNPKLARHLSVFGENAALTEGLEWLKQLQFAKLEKRPEGDLLDAVTRFINQAGFLPHHVKLHEVASRGVVFRDAEGGDVPVTDLSDGYRSILSLTFELIRQLTIAYGPDIFDLKYPDRVRVPGVVLIDEADAHLHPTWQRQIGIWFRTHFPNIQFIVTTHSPLICQAADVGTVFKLPVLGSDEKGRFVEGLELDRLIYGNILDAYSTGAFGDGITRSDESVKRLTRLAELNLRELHGALSTQERQEQTKLQATMPTAASQLPDSNGNGRHGGGHAPKKEKASNSRDKRGPRK
jgi:energy-coupling factor transporter ATP-binding protein EcfA2